MRVSRNYPRHGRAAAFSALLGMMLSGCVLSIHDDGDDGNGDGDHWRARQARNKQTIDHLELGRSMTSVTDELGAPDTTESFLRNGQPYNVLLYRTRLVHSDGHTSRDETTPLVFADGKLVGWGESAIDHAAP